MPLHHAHPTTPDRDQRPSTDAIGLVGRDRELGTLEALLDGLFAARGASRSIIASAGAGKTAVLDAFARRALERSATVIRVAGHEAEADLPWAALSSLCLPYRERFDRLPGPQGAALRSAFALTEADDAIDRLAVSLGVLGLLSDLGASNPTVVLVDDVHWLDPESRAALAFLARRLADDAVLLVAASRPDTPSLPADPLVLPGLPAADVKALLAGAGVRSLAVREAIAGLADGNPLLALQLAGDLTDEERSGSRPVPSTMRVPRQVEDLFRPRISDLPSHTLEALIVVAADGSDDGSAAVDALHRMGRSLADLEPAESSGLVLVDGMHVHFAHPLIRSAVYHHVVPSAKRRAHLELAVSEGETSAKGVLHRAAAAIGPDAGLVDDLVTLARDALQRGAPLIATERYLQAGDSAASPATRAELVLQAARAALTAGEVRWANELVGRAEAVDAEVTDRLGARQIRVRLAAAAGRIDEARRLVDATEDAYAASDPVGVASVLAELARPLLPRAPHVVGQLCLRIWDLAGHADAPASIYAEILLGCGLFVQGDVDGAAPHLDRWRDLLDLEGPVLAGPFLAETVLLYLVLTNQIDQATVMLAEIEGPVRAHCSSEALVAILSARGFLHYGSDLGASVAASREAFEVAEAAGLVGLTPLSLQVVVVAAGTVGDEATVERFAERLLRSDDITDQAYARAGLARLHLVAGRFEAAADQFDRLHAAIGPGNPSTCGFEGDEVESLVRVGRCDEARAVLARLAQASSFGAWNLGQYERSRALLEDDLDQAIVHFEAAGVAFAETGNRIAHGLVELLWGERLRRAKRRAEARRHLERAVELFVLVGATGLCGRARDELRAAGGSHDRSRPTSDLLTPVELQVARLAVAGRTNRDIANHLFISPRTVENHLSAVYRKLGVSGRPQLLSRALEDAALRAATGPL